METSTDIYQQRDSLIGKLAHQLHAPASRLLMAAMTVVIFMEVIFRYFLGEGFKWSQEVCGLCFLMLVFLSQPDTWQENRHIRMDVFYNHFGAAGKWISDILTVVCGLIVYGSVAWQGIADFKYQWEVEESTSELLWPLWPFSLALVISSFIAILLLVRFCAISLILKRLREK